MTKLCTSLGANVTIGDRIKSFQENHTCTHVHVGWGAFLQWDFDTD